MAYRTVAAPNVVALGARMALTLAGVAGLIAGAFLTWMEPMKGTQIAVEAFWRPTFRETDVFMATVGFAMIAVGIVAIVGMALSTGWLTRIAGVLGIIGFVLFTVEVYRAPGTNEIGLGAWLSLAGAFVVLIAGFFGAQHTVVGPATGEAHITEDDLTDRA